MRYYFSLIDNYQVIGNIINQTPNLYSQESTQFTSGYNKISYNISVGRNSLTHKGVIFEGDSKRVMLKLANLYNIDKKVLNEIFFY